MTRRTVRDIRFLKLPGMHIVMATAAGPGCTMERNGSRLVRRDVDFVTGKAGCLLMRTHKLETRPGVIECQRLRPHPVGVTGFAPATGLLVRSVRIAMTRLTGLVSEPILSIHRRGFRLMAIDARDSGMSSGKWKR